MVLTQHNRLCRKTRSGFEGPFFLNCCIFWRIKAAAVVHLAASGSIDDRANIACFAVFARWKNCSLSGRRRGFPTEPRASRPGTTLIELVVAISLMVLVMGAVLPLISSMRKSWDTAQNSADAVQNGRVLIDHLNLNLSQAVKITEVSPASQTLGYIEFEDPDGDIQQSGRLLFCHLFVSRLSPHHPRFSFTDHSHRRSFCQPGDHGHLGNRLCLPFSRNALELGQQLANLRILL